MLSAIKKQPALFFKFFSAIVLPKFQIISIIIVSVMVMLISYGPYYEYNALEQEIPITYITPQQIQKWGVLPTQVRVGLHIISFPSINFIANEFIFDGIIWFEFDPALISLSTVGKFSFEHGTILSKSEPYTQIIENKFFARYNILVKFKMDLDYHQFPFDDHRLDIILVNRSIQPSEMIYRVHSSFFKLSERTISSFSGWQLYGKNVDSGWSEAVLEQYPTQKVVENPIAVFSFGIMRSGLRNILLILLPLFMIYFLSLFSYAFDPKTHAGSIFGLASASATSLLAYRFIIERLSPQVGYFLFSDVIFTIFLIIEIFNFIFAVILVRLGSLTPWISLIRGIMYIAINFTLLISWYYLITQYMPSASL